MYSLLLYYIFIPIFETTMLGKRNNMNTILSLSASKALDFFMKSEQFHGFELPEYFDFDALLVNPNMMRN